MGWYGDFCTKKQKIAMLTESRDAAKCIKHCYRGNSFRGVLWSVWEFRDGSRAIGCDVLSHSQGEWMHKPLDESSGPYYWSCPLGYLALADEQNPEWRNEVRRYHAARTRKKLVQS